MAAPDEFQEFVSSTRPPLARAFAAAYGIHRGQDALSEAMAYAWEHFDSVRGMENPTGYLYRVGQSRTGQRRRVGDFPPPAELGLPEIEPALHRLVAELSERQRVCVVLVCGFQWTHQEVAELLGLRRSTVQNHIERALKHLRRGIGDKSDA